VSAAACVVFLLLTGVADTAAVAEVEEGVVDVIGV